MSQKKVYLYSPDGKSEGWHMELEAPAGWLTSPPEAEVTVEDLEEAGNQMDELDNKQAEEDEETLEELQEQLDRLEKEEE